MTVQKLLNEIVFRHNQESNSRFTTSNVPKEVLEKRTKLATFPLNALNFLPILKQLHTASSKALLNDFVSLINLSEIDDLSFWLVEVPVDKFKPVFSELSSLNLNIDEIDPKLNTIFNRYAELNQLGIYSKDDLVNAMIDLQ